MLDTGVDVPGVVNLVFFKLVRSKTKFWQMMGRGTRLCKNLFGPGEDKAFFHVFDYCQNLEFFKQNPETTDGALGASLGKRLFTARLELLTTLDQTEPGSLRELAAPEPALLHESPFTDINPQGPEGVFAAPQIERPGHGPQHGPRARHRVIVRFCVTEDAALRSGRRAQSRWKFF